MRKFRWNKLKFLKIPIEQKPLPKLPVPDLQHTLQMYLGCLKPVISEEEYQKHEQLVQQFGQSESEGEQLQQKLCDVAKQKENWAYDWWLADMYLKNRLPLPVWSNPGMVFPRQSFKNEEEQLR